MRFSQFIQLNEAPMPPPPPPGGAMGGLPPPGGPGGGIPGGMGMPPPPMGGGLGGPPMGGGMGAGAGGAPQQPSAPLEVQTKGDVWDLLEKLLSNGSKADVSSEKSLNKPKAPNTYKSLRT